MIDLEFIERLIRAIDESSIDSLEIEKGGTRIRMAKSSGEAVAVQTLPVPVAPAPAPVESGPPAVAPASEPVDTPPAPAPNLIEITSPMVGTFYRSPSPDTAAHVDIGSRVKTGDTLCIIEAMKLMNELECEVEGTIVEICVENAEPVEFGQVLFRVEPV